MKTIAIVGAGPTGIYTLFSLLKGETPLSISIYEQAAEAGVGMPYSEDENSRMMLANIASIEIPPIGQTYLDWLRDRDEAFLRRYGVEKSSLHERQFLPRILLGAYFRDRFLWLVGRGAELGFEIAVHEACKVVDLEPTEAGVRLWAAGGAAPALFDVAVIATGHVWPDEEEATRTFFPSPWSGLIEAEIPACRVGIMGTSLSGIDAAMAVAARHGRFREHGDGRLRFDLDEGREALSITLMSRSGILPEADFYCPLPYEALRVATPAAVARAVAAGPAGLLDRVFALVVAEIEAADPEWSAGVALAARDADDFADAYFADRRRHDPFRWAAYNLGEVERNKRDRRTVAWRYAILRLHEAVQDVVPLLDEADRARFDAGLSKVFVDNYAAIPSESIRRLLALREAGVIGVLELGDDYAMEVGEAGTAIAPAGETHRFDLFIDARGQKPLKTRDLPFPRLRRQLQARGNDIPDVGDDYTLLEPAAARGRIAFGALPFLMHEQPFVQGIAASADIGAAMARAMMSAATRPRRRLAFFAS